MFKEVSIITDPDIILVKELAKKLKRKTNTIDVACYNNYIDYGYILRDDRYGERGVKVIIKNQKYYDWREWLKINDKGQRPQGGFIGFRTRKIDERNAKERSK